MKGAVLGVVLAVEVTLLLLTTQVPTEVDQVGIFIVSFCIFPFVWLAFYLIEPTAPTVKQDIVAFPQEMPTAPVAFAPPAAPITEVRPAAVQLTEQMLKTHETPKTPKKETTPFSDVRRRPEIISLVPRSAEISSTPATRTQVPTIVPQGMIGPPEAGSIEQVTTIIPGSLALIKKQGPPPSRKIELLPEELLDINKLLDKAKGMKFSLMGWWPLGWSRVITHQDLPAQFWKLHEGKIVKGVLMGYDMESKQFVAWMARVDNGVFTEINEMTRADSEDNLVTRVKQLMKESDFQEAETAQEISGEK